jgi:Reverse transcriptase (RNA-dependent DNA polymerase)
LKDDAKPVHCKPFPVPQKHAEVFNKECKRLCDEDVLVEPVGATEHAYPTFIIPKKDGTVRWVSDFRKLNANLRRRVYPLPRIQDVLHRRPNYQYFTKIDLSMCYYTFELDEKSKNMCVVVTPFGKFRFKRLPMGISQAPDLCQEIMESILKDIPDVEVFLDDIGIFSQDYRSHMKTIATVLTRLQLNGFTVNPLKCEWAVQETDWLGYWLTPTGL